MRARKVQINASNSSQPERFKTAREAQKAADECNIPGEINPVIVGCCGPRFYVLLVDDGEVVKYYSELSEAWFPVCADEESDTEDVLDAEELEVLEEAAAAEAGCEDQGECDSVNEEELTAGKEQINAADAMIMDFLWDLAKKEGWKVSYEWQGWGCCESCKADKGKLEFVFDHPFNLPKIRTERGEYVMGGFSTPKTRYLIDRLHQLFDLQVERKYAVPTDGPNGFEYQCTSWGPVLSMDMDEMLLACQREGRGKRQSL